MNQVLTIEYDKHEGTVTVRFEGALDFERGTISAKARIGENQPAIIQMTPANAPRMFTVITNAIALLK